MRDFTASIAPCSRAGGTRKTRRRATTAAEASHGPYASNRQIEASARAAFGGRREPRDLPSVPHEIGHQALSTPAHTHDHRVLDVSRTPSAVRPAGKTRSFRPPSYRASVRSTALAVCICWIHRRLHRVIRLAPMRGPSRSCAPVDGDRRGSAGLPRPAVLSDRRAANRLAVFRARTDIRRRTPSSPGIAQMTQARASDAAEPPARGRCRFHASP